MVPTAHRIACLDWSFILPPSFAVRKRRGAVWRLKQIRSELARVSPALTPSRAYGIGSARRTLYACPLPHAMKGYLRFVLSLATSLPGNHAFLFSKAA